MTGPGLANCFSGNTFTSSSPSKLEELAPCTGTGTGDWKEGSLDLVALMASERPGKGDYKDQADAPQQPNMPDAATAPAHPAIDVPFAIDLAAIKVPAKPAG
jgi:hypothetical protein